MGPLEALATAGTLIEVAIFYAAPRLLASFAFVPIGKEAFIELTRHERDALVEPIDGELGYRERRPERLALERLAEQNVFGKRYIAWVHPTSGTIIARTRYAKGNLGVGLTRTRLRARGDRIVATTYMLPCPALLWPIMVGAVAQRPTAGMLVVTLLVGAAQVWLPRRQLLQAREDSLEHLHGLIRRAARRRRKQLAGLSDGRPPL